MSTTLLRTFQRQVLLQCTFMIRAANDINISLQRADIEGVFYGIQNMLNAAANISKALWGQAGKLSTERKDLRDSIRIDDDSPLREVTMRNNFEHFDERLERWWKESTTRNYADLNIGGQTGISGLKLTDVERFRDFDPQTMELTFWGQSFNLQALITEVQKILPKLQAEASKAHWEK